MMPPACSASACACRRIARSLALALTSLVTVLQAVELPQPSPHDPRVRLVRYLPQQVTLVKVQRGAVTRITLGDDERIEMAVTGLSARCDKDEDAWCIRADRGGNQVFVRPKDAARRNNMELRTTRGDYSFEFHVLPDSAAPETQTRTSGGKTGKPQASQGFFRVVFEYPEALNASSSAGPNAGASTSAAVTQAWHTLAATDPANAREAAEPRQDPARLLAAQPPQVRNAQYTMQVLDKGEDSAPSMVFDDGRFTYFEFLGAREIPAIFAYGSDDIPTRANWHMQGNFVVVQRTARRFTLRLGDATTGVFNEAFDPVGVETPSGTVSPSVRRIPTAGGGSQP